MCGIVGIVQKDNCFTELYDALIMLQHRGQDAAGITICEGSTLNSRKSKGFVREVFTQRHFERLKGNYGIGHVRYPTAGGNSKEYAQPMYVNSPYGISLAHNGNLSNTKELAAELFSSDLRHISTDSDSEVLLNILAHEISKNNQKEPNPETLFKAVETTFKRCEGSINVVSIITGHGLLAFRDRYGIRPLSLGSRSNSDGTKDYMISSESAAFSSSNYYLERDLHPGEAIFISTDGEMHTKICSDNTTLTPCLFEYVYFARPDSKIDEVSVYKARMRMGSKLAEQIKKTKPDHDIDVVIPIPDSSTTAAHELAVGLGIPYREGFVKNRYIGRTFIMPYQEERKKSVRRKLNILDLEFQGKNVLLVDDSIVRGTTSKKIIEMARASGAKKVYFASAAPPIKYQNLYGIDMPSTSELIASNQTNDEVAKEIDADWLIYQTLDDLIDTVQVGNPEINEFETSIFTGKYITPLVENYLEDLENSRKDELKMQREKSKANG